MGSEMCIRDRPLPPSRSGRVNPNASRHACGTDESQPTLHSSHPSRFDATPLTELGANSQEKHLVPAAPSIFYVNPIGHGERSDPSSAPLSSFKHDNRECWQRFPEQRLEIGIFGANWREALHLDYSFANIDPFQMTLQIGPSIGLQGIDHAMPNQYNR